MRWKSIAIASAALVAVGGIVFAGVRGNAADRRRLDTPKEKLSYAMGVAMARNFKGPGLELDKDMLASGFKDGSSGRELLMAEDELRDAIGAFQGEMKQKQVQAVKRRGAISRNEGNAFLAQNAKEEGVVTLPSGLQYKVFRAGNGETPEDGARGLPARKKGGPAIGPNETLIFEVELLAIKPEAQARAQAASVKAAPAAKER